MNTRKFSASHLAVALAAAGVFGAAGATAFQRVAAPQAVPAPAASVPAAAPVGAVTPPDFSQITERYGPAVVNISVTGTTQVANDEDDPFAQFFRGFPGYPGGGSQSVPVRGQGSGFIVSPDGVILTNAHVVKGAKEVTVKLTDRREFRAKVLGSDPQTDVAVLKIDAGNLPVVTIGNPNSLRVGEWVLAIGSPYGLESTVTAGVVSAKGRSLPNDGSVPFIQTDVAVNPGNSGGPLFNARGEVVGINSQIYSQTGGYQGLSFAIPIDVAAKVKDQILAHGEVRHARLGVTIQDVNQALADSFKLDSPTGALVANVEKGSPADKAGLQSGDIIRKIDGKPVVASGDLPAVVSLASPGQEVRLEVWRNGSPREVVARLGSAKADATAQAGAPGDAGNGRLGLALRPLTPQEQRAAGGDAGLVIEQVGGPAEQAGIEPGDLLLSLNGVPVQNVEQVRALLDKAGKTVALLVQRGDAKIFVPVRLG
ncbi:MAG: DegQ family serine endoprotease [Pigmentiphaga sp.]|uniref:DegQ family serine endoprotease n=1 Tax=Pigmentiphaga sp. TaxID=1977564 RepID=UPI0029A87308|nr:DegQ family serine endoprotease [Pigmentiphaga sp.]MDX3906870.1 DegQ family serine endoprotease [Pigmentiphaga sp.]